MTYVVDMCSVCSRVLGPAPMHPTGNDPLAFRWEVVVCSKCRDPWFRTKTDHVKKLVCDVLNRTLRDKKTSFDP